MVVPDADLLIHGSYHRSGLDLVLTGHDGRHHVIPGYFASEHPLALVAPNGAHFSADLVGLLAGSPAPHEYAQAQGQAAAPVDSVGKIQKITGDVAVQRNGVSVALNVGDVVYKSDVIVTGADSKCGLTFPDGTALEFLPNTRTRSASAADNRASQSRTRKRPTFGSFITRKRWNSPTPGYSSSILRTSPPWSRRNATQARGTAAST